MLKCTKPSFQGFDEFLKCAKINTYLKAMFSGVAWQLPTLYDRISRL